MSSQVYRFKVGEQVMYPRILLGPEGKHQVVESPWQIKAIFPVSELALITQVNVKKGTSIHVGLDKLMLYN